MFGLKNIHGSCWVNTCLQLLFRIPDVQQRYESETFKPENEIDECLSKIWKSKGELGLRDFFDLIYYDTLPAGKGIGDSDELLTYLCDKIPFLNNLFRFKIADSIRCKHCDYKELREESVIEFSIATPQKNVPLVDCIADVVKEYDVDEWTCEKCHKKGCRKQQLIGSFPNVMAFHLVPLDGNVEYMSILGLNKQSYALVSVACYNGVHWWAYGRDMPPGLSWYTFDDTRVEDHGSKQFPLSSKARLLIYYRLEK